MDILADLSASQYALQFYKITPIPLRKELVDDIHLAKGGRKCGDVLMVTKFDVQIGTGIEQIVEHHKIDFRIIPTAPQRIAQVGIKRHSQRSIVSRVIRYIVDIGTMAQQQAHHLLVMISHGHHQGRPAFSIKHRIGRGAEV
ncbi:hypothetical protein [Novosphingobium sp. ST904]|uniref:hypothetical protein n=1 Tax=Novosphingobium sp. ST904 TaxID=1684385 RepID=UPI0006C87308|nr:hypothetical protein [Novosphingobium sp. ST904]KPH58863.1 hypothetical protein ADT71_24695 [Novosphingobium sp. ST904]